MIDDLRQAGATATASQAGQRPPLVRPNEPPFPPMPSRIDRGPFGNSSGPGRSAPSSADRRQAAVRLHKPDEFGGILPSQAHRERPAGQCRTLLAAVLQATAADLGRGGECRAEALRWVRYRRLPEDRSLGFTLGELCERLDLDAQWTREWLVAIEVDLAVASGRGRRTAGPPHSPRQSRIGEFSR